MQETAHETSPRLLPVWRVCERVRGAYFSACECVFLCVYDFLEAGGSTMIPASMRVVRLFNSCLESFHFMFGAGMSSAYSCTRSRVNQSHCWCMVIGCNALNNPNPNGTVRVPVLSGSDLQTCKSPFGSPCQTRRCSFSRQN